ncbi:MAG: alpha/beta hydrolase [Fluviicoccus sp.]|uniref:alpha/beta fold hydrolase n=1 Tax=Fluviicoccus sp. TaxID=2003552 RepID=UPI002725C289|nr:alpha/beta hydrolase [Fluviicoccus sp.]MDO8332193.1 alpha/beta hydrolase [Fluviicoccus sp.]
MNVREGFVEAEGHRLAYLAVNEHLAREDEPAIVFIHGVLASVNFWRDCVPPGFKDDRAWYALSLPAHFPSTVPPDFSPGQVNSDWFFRIMNQALQALLVERKAIVVGHSTGGFSALNLAIHHAPNVLGIVSVAGFHRGQWGSVEGLLVRLAGLGNWAKGLFVANIRISQKSRLVRSIFASLLAYDHRAYRANPLSRRMLANIEGDTVRQDPVALFTLFNGIGRLEIADQLRRITMPCHILAGAADPVVTAGQSLVLAGEIPHAKLVVFRHVGHMPFMECPDAFFAALEQALRDIARQTHFPQSRTQVTAHELS